jgi:hypothetical protein
VRWFQLHLLQAAPPSLRRCCCASPDHARVCVNLGQQQPRLYGTAWLLHETVLLLLPALMVLVQVLGVVS